ncbi:TraX family protein [Pseudomonadota bacterium]
MDLRPVDNYDWLKTVAIIMVAVDHFGYFFIEDAAWWSAFGRMAAPPFFFLLGYAQSRIVPFRWIWLAAILTLLDSWNNDWAWVAPNILFSLALIRVLRPNVQVLLQKYGWTAFALLVSVFLIILPVAAEVVDYGAEGWLWALFGLCQRMFVDSRTATDADGIVQYPATPKNALTQKLGQMRLLACFIAAAVYLWQEQLEFSFSQAQFAAVILGIGALCLGLCRFLRGPSRIQPPEPIAGVLRFFGRHTLEIYFIQLAGSELIIKLWPDLAP